MSFSVGAEAYDRFMGRYSAPLAAELANFAGITVGLRVLDVGCGPGALTAELVRRLGPDAVAAVDPSESFVAAARQRQPGVNVQRAAAERLPFGDRAFDAALAQLVVHFMAEPVVGLREVEERVLSVDVEHPSFEEWWEPFTLGVGPAGAHVAGLDAKQQAQLRERCRELLPEAPFVLTARAWATRGLV